MPPTATATRRRAMPLPPAVSLEVAPVAAPVAMVAPIVDASPGPANMLASLTAQLRAATSQIETLTARAEKAEALLGGRPAVERLATLEAASKRTAELEARVLSHDVEALMREGRDAGKLTAGFEPAFRRLASRDLAFARESLATMPVVIDRSVRTPGKVASGALWDDLTLDQKATLQREDPDLFNVLLSEHRSRVGGKGVSK